MNRPDPRARARAPRRLADENPSCRRTVQPALLVWLALGIAAAAACRQEQAPRHLQAPREDAPPAAAAASAALRVCADPNNLPFSNDRLEGFENAIAELVARDLGKPVAYTWWPQRRGFIRSTLGAGLCDVVIGVPERFEMALTTRPYYRSTYVFVEKRERTLHLTSLDDPRLRRLRIGVHVVGDDYASVPPAAALAARGIVDNVRGYSIYGSYDRPNPPADLLSAVANGEVDVAVAWGPLGGYFATPALAVTPIEPLPGVELQFAISMGVRRGDVALRDRLNEILQTRRDEIDAVLDRFHVPRVAAASP